MTTSFLGDVGFSYVYAIMTGNEAVPVPGDFDGDGDVDAGDLATLLSEWGPCEGCTSDLEGDGVVDAGDLAVLLGNWG